MICNNQHGKIKNEEIFWTNNEESTTFFSYTNKGERKSKEIEDEKPSTVAEIKLYDWVIRRAGSGKSGQIYIDGKKR